MRMEMPGLGQIESAESSQTRARRQTPESHGRTIFGGRLSTAAAILLNLLLVSGLMVLTGLIFTLSYLTPDDPAFSLIAAGCGITAHPDAHLPYCHIWLGTIIRTLYAWAPTLPWYALTQLSGQGVALIAIGTVLVRRMSWLGTAAFLLLFLSLFVQMECAINFTFAPCLLGLAGVLTLLQGLEEQLRQRRGPKRLAVWALVSITLIAAGSLGRFSSVPLTIMLSVPVLVLRFGLLHWRQGAAGMAALTAAFLLSYGFDQVNTAEYAKEPGWQDSLPVIAMVQQFVDYDRGCFSPSTAATYKEIGWTPDDMLMAKTYFVRDPQVFSLHNMQTLLHQASPWRGDLSLGLVQGRLASMLDWRLVPALLLVLGALAGSVSVPRQALKPALYGLYCLAALVFLAAAFKLPRQVYLPIVAFTLTFGAFYLSPQSLALIARKLLSKRAGWLIATGIWAILLGGSLVQEFQCLKRQSGQAKLASQQLKASLKELDRSTPYLLWDAMPYQAVLPLDDVSSYFSGFKLLAPHISRTGIFSQRLADFGINNVFDAIAKGEVLVIGNDRLNWVYSAFVQQHYHQNIAFQRLPVNGTPPAFQLFCGGSETAAIRQPLR